MATSSRQSALFGVQDWKKFYQTYRSADFQSFDYETLRKSFIDYIVLNYPENFNDYIESSEFVALLDVIAFMGQALAFRGDLNSRENFIDTAERRDSIIKLANLVGYTPKRNINAHGLLKVTAISTSENVIDINGNNLSNTVVLWNDLANDIWKEQFNSIINSALVSGQRVGAPYNSQNILNIKTDEYSLNIPSEQLPVIPFTSEIDNILMDFELVSVSSVGKESLYELTPIANQQFNFLYRNDKLGHGSPDTGFFFYFKQGTLRTLPFQIQDKIENNTYRVELPNVNNNDVWLVEIDDNGIVTSTWDKTDNIYSNNNRRLNSNKKIFSVLSRANDQITYLFGDDIFGSIPVGSFIAYVRTSNGISYDIRPDELADITLTIDYVSKTNRIEQLTLTLSLQQKIIGAMQRETTTAIKERAPAKYYTQNRMVNGEDYNTFPFINYSNILKSKAINRTSVGVSRNKDLTDPTGKYSNTSIFSDDGVLYVENYDFVTSFSLSDPNLILEFFNIKLPNILSSNEVLQYYYSNFIRITGKYFNTDANNISSDGLCYWKQKSIISNNVTGYFFIKDSYGNEKQITVGANNSTNLKFISSGAHIKFISPSGKYFDKMNRLQNGSPSFENEGSLYIWAKVENIISETNSSSNGGTSVILNKYIPDNAILDSTMIYENEILLPQKYYGSAIIPAFTNTFNDSLITQINLLLAAKVSSFKLIYDIMNADKWIISRTNIDEENLIIKFTYVPAENRYDVNVKNIKYIFSSTENVKFIFNVTEQLVLSDTNKLISDTIYILKINSNPNYNGVSDMNPSLVSDIKLNVYGQSTFKDGILNDYSLVVSNINSLTKTVDDPDFFTKKITRPSNNFVFFRKNIDESNLENNILHKDEVITAYPTENIINNVKYEYQPGTIFYAYGEKKFFISVVVPLTSPLIITLENVSDQYYMEYGNSNIKFHYIKNNNYYTRINPSVTNIIDIYLVTEGYYREYQTWLSDITNVISRPIAPSMIQLKQEFNGLDNYKMLTDNIILNSVVFKPIFGNKASPELRGTIKVIKNPYSNSSESQIRSEVLVALNSYFTLDKWDFGDTFYFSELSAYLHVELSGLISSVVVVPLGSNSVFGDLYEIKSAPSEIFVNGATINDIIVINSLTSRNLQT